MGSIIGRFKRQKATKDDYLCNTNNKPFQDFGFEKNRVNNFKSKFSVNEVGLRGTPMYMNVFRMS